MAISVVKAIHYFFIDRIALQIKDTNSPVSMDRGKMKNQYDADTGGS